MLLTLAACKKITAFNSGRTLLQEDALRFLCGLRDRCDHDAIDAALRRFVTRSAFRVFVNIRHISSLNAVELNMISRRS